LKRFATDARSCLSTACALAALIFFDDYASILIVGNSFRPLLPLLGVCRAKFAAVLHYVAVCVSACSPVSSWIGQEVGMVSTACAGIPAAAGLPSPFVLTLKTLPYRFFPLALLAFTVANVATDRDFGPMRAAVEEHTAAPSVRASAGDGNAPADAAAAALEPPPGTPLRALNALVPFGTIIGVTLGGMVLDGKRALLARGAPATLLGALSAGDSVLALLWGSTAGAAAAMALLLSQKILDLETATATFVEGAKDVVEPIIVLALAWALGGIIGATGTADFIARVMTAGGVPLWGLPAITSALAYAISFATGSSFGTMGILFPLIGPLAWKLGGGSEAVLAHCFGAVLGGSLFGNVFSPIADTTILTQLATKVPLTEHVKTAGPYACVVGGLCLALADLPVGLGLLSPVAALGVVVAAQTGILRVFGKKPSE
jgi:Na+/H+ antiporter NhaC